MTFGRTRRALLPLAGVALALGVHLGAPPPVAACSCVGPEPMAAYAGSPERVIFSGTVQVRAADGLPVVVSTWFQGRDPAPVVRLQGWWGQQSASCETPLPPAGTDWIFVTYREESGELSVNACTAHAPLASALGAAMLADAVATFGGIGMGAASNPAGLPAELALPTESTAVILAVTVGAAGGLLGGVALVARSRRRGDAG